MNWTPLYTTLAIFGISFLVIVHEAGHYFAARAFGMRVLRFSIGLGPVLWKFKPKDSATTFQVCAIPLLAYVQIDGMNPAEEIDPRDPSLYPNKSVFARIVTIFAGPLANYLAAALMVFLLHVFGGFPQASSTNVVGIVTKHSAAHEAGMQPGDRVVAVEGRDVSNGEQLIEANRGRAGRETEYVVLRDGERVRFRITPDAHDGRAILGIQLSTEWQYATTGIGEAAKRSVLIPWAITVMTFDAIGNMIKRRSTEDVTSVVGMTTILADSIKLSPQHFIALLINLSVALGLFNLLPVPALDGGRLAFLGYELVTRRRANERVEAAVHTVGLLFLLGVLALVMVRDVMKLT